MGLFEVMQKLKKINTVIQASKWKKGECRDQFIKIRVTKDEKEAFELLGRSMGTSAMVRHAVLDLYLNKFIKDCG